MTDIFTYLDYRTYLTDVFCELKDERASFSHRAFARMAGFSSSNFVMLVMQGKRNLSSAGIQKVVKGLKLKKAEAEFFENLVRFNQAKTDTEKNFYYERISSNRRYAQAKPLEKGEFEYYSHWYIPAIREMVLMDEFQDDPEWIAAKLTPQIAPREAEHALKLLFDLGFIKKDESGRIVQTHRHVASGDEVRSLALTNFHREMIDRAAVSIEATPPDRREIGSITFAVSKDKLAEAKKMIRTFRSKLSGFLAEEHTADAVYQFNLQLFNLTDIKKDSTNRKGEDA